MTYVIGISALYHDSAAALLKDGQIVAAAQEERFSRKRHDSRFPNNAIKYCLEAAGITLHEVRAVVFYEKPIAKFGRLLRTYLAYAPIGVESFASAMPRWLAGKLQTKRMIRKKLLAFVDGHERDLPELLFTEHHQSHAASAYYASPFKQAAVLCLDGVGEWATTSVWLGSGSTLEPLWQMNFPHSLGLLYSAFTYYTGFKVDSGEYKLMGLAPYGRPIYKEKILTHLIDVKEDGTFRMDMSYFNYMTGLTMTNAKFDDLFGAPPRPPESPISQREMDLAASIQVVTEEIVLRLARTIHRETNEKYLCLAGGVALNCVANGRLCREGPFSDVWIQPAAGDAGAALGAAYVGWHDYFGGDREIAPNARDAMQGSYLGPEYSEAQVKATLDALGAAYVTLDEDQIMSETATLLEQEKVIGWFQGRMEFGPRALGARSIIGNPQSATMQSVMNQKIKFRESFRPFAPSVLAEKVSQWFDLDTVSPYMLFVAPVTKGQRQTDNGEDHSLLGIDRLKALRSNIPAVTHVDYSARVQTVDENSNQRYYRLISEFEKLTGCPILVNTSFNVRGEPIVESPEDAYRCFMRTNLDFLVVGNCLLDKRNQPAWKEAANWRNEFALD